MTDRYAVVDESGEVVNVILWDGIDEYDPGEGVTLRPLGEKDPVGPGHRVVAGKYVAPEPKVEPDA